MQDRITEGGCEKEKGVISTCATAAFSTTEVQALRKLGEELVSFHDGTRENTLARFANELPLQYHPHLAPKGLELETERGALVADFFTRKTRRECTNVFCKKVETGFVDIMVSQFLN